MSGAKAMQAERLWRRHRLIHDKIFFTFKLKYITECVGVIVDGCWSCQRQTIEPAMCVRRPNFPHAMRALGQRND